MAEDRMKETGTAAGPVIAIPPVSNTAAGAVTDSSSLVVPHTAHTPVTYIDAVTASGGGRGRMFDFVERGFLKEPIALLTKAYQVDAEDMDAMRQLTYEVDPQRDRNLFPDYDLIRRAVRLAHSMMQHIFDGAYITEADRVTLDDMKMNLKSTVQIWTEKTPTSEQETLDRRIPVSNLHLTPTTVRGTELLVSRIINDLDALIQNHSMMKLCEECGSIFLHVKGKPGQKFCSDRCGNRARVKKHRSLQSNG